MKEARTQDIVYWKGKDKSPSGPEIYGWGCLKTSQNKTYEGLRWRCSRMEVVVAAPAKHMRWKEIAVICVTCPFRLRTPIENLNLVFES